MHFFKKKAKECQDYKLRPHLEWRGKSHGIVVTPMISALIWGVGGRVDYDMGEGGLCDKKPAPPFPAGPWLCGGRLPHQAARSPKCRSSTSVGSGVGAGIREEADGNWGVSERKGAMRCEPCLKN